MLPSIKGTVEEIGANQLEGGRGCDSRRAINRRSFVGDELVQPLYSLQGNERQFQGWNPSDTTQHGGQPRESVTSKVGRPRWNHERIQDTFTYKNYTIADPLDPQQMNLTNGFLNKFMMK